MIIPYQHTINNTQQTLILIIVWYLIILTVLDAQPIPNEFFQFKSQKLLYDAGENWKTLTHFGPVRYQHLNKSKENSADSLYIKVRAGLYTRKDGIALYGFGYFTYQKYFFGYLYPRIVNEVNTFQRYSGIPRDNSRGGFSSGETDLSGIGFQNSWVTLQVGRGRESWGAGNDIQLALSEESPAYDYAMLGSDYGNLRVKYIHGFLESTKEGINRYVTTRGMEWTNKKSLVIGLSEIVIYSGLNRPIDLGYMNPISSHLEIELNKRLNVVDPPNVPSSANGVWQVSLDWLFKNRIRLSGNYLYDEFVIDQDIELNKEHGKAYSGRVAYTPVKSKKNNFSIYVSLIQIGTSTLRHSAGTNNFVQRGLPLGWQRGSDGRELILGFNYFNRSNFIASIKLGKLEQGQESITYRPYDKYADYLAGSFPSGNIDESLFITSELQWWWKQNISLMGSLEWNKPYSGNTHISVKIGLDIYLPIRFTI